MTVTSLMLIMLLGALMIGFLVLALWGGTKEEEDRW